jgi:hypothetical protein
MSMSPHPRYRLQDGQPVLIAHHDERRNVEIKKLYLVHERI